MVEAIRPTAQVRRVRPSGQAALVPARTLAARGRVASFDAMLGPD